MWFLSPSPSPPPPPPTKSSRLRSKSPSTKKKGVRFSYPEVMDDDQQARIKVSIKFVKILLFVVAFGNVLVALHIVNEKDELNAPTSLKAELSSSGGGLYSSGTSSRRLRRLGASSNAAPWRASPTSFGESTPRHFLFEEAAVVMTSNGVHMTQAELELESSIREHLLSSLCAGDSEGKACRREPEVYKCLSCSGSSEGTWYSAVTHAGSVAGLFDRSGQALAMDDASIRLVDQKDKTWRFDIVVPLSQQDDQLLKFASRLGTSLKKLRWWHKDLTVDVRLMVTRYPADAMAPEKELAFRKELAKEAAITSGVESIQFVHVTPKPGASIPFSRSQAGNALHKNACHDDPENCIVAMMDVDMDLSPSFFRNARALVHAGVSIYTPIVWSEYNPDIWHLVDDMLKLYENKTLPKFSPHRGTWRQYGFGIYAISGADAPSVLYKEDFDGWGGEDNAFMGQAEQRLHVVRRREKGLTHIWHPKICDPTFVAPSQLRACIGSTASVEGSQLGLHLQKMKKLDKAAYKALLSPSPDALANSAAEPAGEPVLIVVATCRKNFVSRVGTIAKTWAGASLPREVTIWYAVGKGSGDMAALARQAGVPVDSIVVMSDVADDEYPPVRRNGAMIQHVSKRLEAEGSKFNWVLKVDDDTYVNVPGLQSFVAKENPDSGYQVWGQRGFGRPGADREGMLLAGFTKPFCMGGPGYLMNRDTWSATAAGMDATIQHVDESTQRTALWHSDIVIGLGVQRATNAGCWDRRTDQAESKILFAQNYQKEENFVKDADLAKVITMHPLKDGEAMIRQHHRYKSAQSMQQGGSLIVVTTTRSNFVKRALAVRNTWGGNLLPDGVTVWFAVEGTKDATADAKRAGVSLDRVVLTGSNSDTVRRSVAVMQKVSEMMLSTGRKFDWILRIEDDTFVNPGALQTFVKNLDPKSHQIWGRRGFGQPGAERMAFVQAGLTKPFCLAGSGYLMSYNTWVDSTDTLETCVAGVHASPRRSDLWKSDVVLGLCIQEITQASCWDRSDHADGSKVFMPKNSAGPAKFDSTIAFPFPSAFLM